MRWLVFPLAVGLAHAADASELDIDYLRGSTGLQRTHNVVPLRAQGRVIPLPAQDRPLLDVTPAYEIIQPPAQERAVVAPAVPKPTVWTGFYVGMTAGGAVGSFGPATSTVDGGYMDATQAAAVNAAGNQSITPAGFAAGIEAGYNWQFGRFLLGAEADLQALHLNGSANSGAVGYPGAPGLQFVVSSYGNSDWLFTARARAGVVTDNNWLVFFTGGLALTQLESDFLFTDNLGVLESARINSTKTGYTVGGGVEAPLTNRLSLKGEYQFVNFGNTIAPVTGNNLTPFFPNQVFSHTGNLTANILRVGLNYRFADGNPWPDAAVSDQPPYLRGPLLDGSGWEVEAGSRVWFSSGRIGAPQPLLNSATNTPINATLASGLTFSGLSAISGEAFARMDQSSGLFVKGYLGAGGIRGGKLNDEDFPAAGAYSNTLSSASGNIAYGTLDLGYSFLSAPGAKLGAFAGYNHYEEGANAYGCVQIAGAVTCNPATPFPASFLGIAQAGHYDSLRIGLSSQLMLTDRLRLTADAAYLPWVNFKGQDDHNARELLLPEASSSGDGVMLEAILGYNITEAWNVGAGGRYWAWNTRNGGTTFNFLGASSPIVEPARFTSERYGMFVQSSYKWGDTTPVTKGFAEASAPKNWTGFYVGGHLGGGWSNDRWSDPFGSAPSGLGAIDIAGFGDTTRATGPLGGGQVGFDWQTGHAVFGLQADASAANLRGDNTCFSGLGGVDCQRVINALATLTGRVGYAWGRSLAYVKGGGAWTDATYSLNGNTNALALGAESTGIVSSGWTAGGGIEYALTGCWSTLLEYDYIGVSRTTVAFPMVATISASNIAVQQAINTVKLGVNYRFGSVPVVVAKY